jgi:hypothetical protein
MHAPNTAPPRKQAKQIFRSYDQQDEDCFQLHADAPKDTKISQYLYAFKEVDMVVETILNYSQGSL